MQIFLDQMIGLGVVKACQELGHDVQCAAEMGLARADDLEILQYCTQANRILITLDDHFGDWTTAKLDRHSGVIRIKVNPTSNAKILELLVPFLRTHSNRDFANTLAIVRKAGIRWVRTVQE